MCGPLENSADRLSIDLRYAADSRCIREVIRMKKGIAMVIIVFMLCSGISHAKTVEDPGIIETLNQGEVYINGEIRTDIKDVQYVGNGYLVKREENGEQVRYFTTDFQNFKPVTIFNDHESDDLVYPYKYDSFSRGGTYG